MPVTVNLSPSVMGWRPMSELIKVAIDTGLPTSWAVIACMKKSSDADDIDDYHLVLGYAGYEGKLKYDYPGPQDEYDLLVPVAWYAGGQTMEPEAVMAAMNNMANTWTLVEDLTYEHFVESLLAVTVNA